MISNSRINVNCPACPIVRLLLMENNVGDIQTKQLETIAGLSDQSGEYVRSKNVAITDVTRLLEDGGFSLFDYPVIEPTELYVRKSGGGISDRLYSFIDPGGNEVSLRPEFTSSVIRSYLKEFGELNKIVKRQYYGPVFRYSDLSPGTHFRQFTQQGCEIIGPDQVNTDSEILGLAIDSLAVAGVTSLTVRLGNVGAIRKLLYSYGLSEAICIYVLSNISKLCEGERELETLVSRAARLGLVQSDLSNDLGKNSDVSRDDSIKLVQSLMAESLSGNTGRRTREEIVDRLLKKKDKVISIEIFRNALNDLGIFLSNMAGIYNPSKAGDNASALEEEQYEYLDSLITCVGTKQDQDIEIQYVLDFAPERGLMYYTGLLFDISVESDDSQIVLGGGGRYDGLVKSLGGVRDVDAVGFAINVDAVLTHV